LGIGGYKLAHGGNAVVLVKWGNVEVEPDEAGRAEYEPPVAGRISAAPAPYDIEVT
jgi:hypothetical protein